MLRINVILIMCHLLIYIFNITVGDKLELDYILNILHNVYFWMSFVNICFVKLFYTYALMFSHIHTDSFIAKFIVL